MFGFNRSRKEHCNGIGSSQSTSESQLSGRHLGKLFQSLSVGVVYRLCSGTSLRVAWNWYWMTGAEVFRLMAAPPCSFMMMMCMMGYYVCGLRIAGGEQH